MKKKGKEQKIRSRNQQKFFARTHLFLIFYFLLKILISSYFKGNRYIIYIFSYGYWAQIFLRKCKAFNPKPGREPAYEAGVGN